MSPGRLHERIGSLLGQMILRLDRRTCGIARRSRRFDDDAERVDGSWL
ncbi:MAG: hypothetical protein R3C05_28695 [Pirellulaceae bacterium]